MKFSFNTIACLGLSNAIKSDDTLRIKLINQIAILLFCLEIPYFFIFQKMGLYQASLWVIPSALSNLGVLFLNHRKQHVLAGLSLIFFWSITLLYYACALGKGANAQLVYFSLIPLGFIFFFKKGAPPIAIGTFMPLLSLLLLEVSHFSLFPNLFLPIAYVRLISIFSNITAATLLIMSVYFFYTSLKRMNEQLETSNTKLEDQNLALQTAYAELQAQQNLLEKTWQEYGFTSKLSGTLRLSEIVDLTAKTILQHFDLCYLSTVSSGDISTLETWVLDNGLPIRTRQDIFESQICYTYEKGPILSLSAAHVGTSVLEILDPIPAKVLHLAITENESRYILIGPKKSGSLFSDSDLKLLQALSAQAITALQRALPYEDAVHRYGLAIKQESAYQMLVTLQHQINSPLSAAKMAMDTLSKTQIQDNASVIAKMGKEALDSVVAVMRRMRQISQLRETTYLGDIKMWDIGDEAIAATEP